MRLFAGVPAIFVSLILILFSSCGPSESNNGIMSEQDVVSYCDQVIKDVEQGSGSEQLDAFDQVKEYVANYQYPETAMPAPALFPAPADPETLEPMDEADLYRMFGTLALLNGNGSASLWLSANAARLAPGDSNSLSHLGVVLLEQGGCKEAEQLLKTAKSKDTDQDELLRLSLAAALACRGMLGQARQEVAEALEIKPSSVMARTAMMKYRGEQMDVIVGLEGSLYAMCQNDVEKALALGSTQEVADFIEQQEEAGNVLLKKMGDLYSKMPMDLPPDLMSDIAGLQGEYESHNALISNTLDNAVDNAMDSLLKNKDRLAQEEGDCCTAAGAPCCDCQHEFCSGEWGYLENNHVTAVEKALDVYLQDALTALVQGELELTGKMMSAFPGMSDQAVTWTAGIVYNSLTGFCNSISGEVAAAKGSIFAGEDAAEAECGAIDIACKTGQHLADLEAQRKRMQQQLEEEAAKFARLVKKFTMATDDGLVGEACLDSLGCLGIDHGKFSVKIGGPIFAQFSLDTDKVSIGVRVGVGISDPTGGNIVGADVSIGGEIGTSGTSFDIKHSQSAALGTVKKEYKLFKSKFDF
ncbi:MAG: hypothetical protein GXP49_14015 [Deltaproteobacteria bacterium]|nr:hypothetical protein [Deltaproteobacteria bacterium]